MNISFSGSVLNISSEITASFPHDIKKVIAFDEVIVVLLDVAAGVILNENVFGLSFDGKKKWQIERIVPDKRASSFVNIEKTGEGLDAYNWSGIRARVNLETGKVVHKRITK